MPNRTARPAPTPPSQARPVATLLAASLLLPLLAACGGEQPTRAAQRPGGPGEGPREVRVVEAERAALPDVVTVAGTLAAEEETELALKVAGRVNEMHVDLGSAVESGQVLARLAPSDYLLRVEQATAALAQAQARLGLSAEDRATRVDPEQTGVVKRAQAQLVEARARRERARALFEEKLLPQAELDTAEAAYQVAESQYQDAVEEVLNRQGVLAQRRSELELARQQLADSVLRAPYSGAVSERHATPGQFVAAGQPIVTLVRTHPLRLRLAVPERQAARVQIGQEVRVRVEGDSRLYAGRVARTSPAIEESDRTLMIEAEVPNEDRALRPGSFASAEIVTAAAQPAILVPATAVVVFAGIEKVMAVEDGKAVEKRVRTGRRIGERAEILEGLEGGELVVAEPGNLVGGQEVTIVQ